MRRCCSVVLVVFFGFISGLQTSALAYSPSIYGKQNLTVKLHRIIEEAGGSADVGVQIKSMRSGDVLYSKNAYDLFVPASIMKILTAEAALLYLGPNYTFPTRLLTDATSINHGIIEGNVYLVHSGDPSLTYTDLTDLLVALKSQAIQGIAGNIYIDTTAYDQANLGPGWISHDKQYCYAAPINASIINHNCLSFKIAPSKVGGHKANVITDPHYYYSGIENSVMTNKSGRFRSRFCSVQLSTTANNGIAISGCIPKGHYVWGASTVIADIIGYNKSLLHWLFRRYGIRVGGDITVGSAPSGLSVVAIHQSKPLSALVKEMLKKSDNIIAGSLFKKMGELYSKQPGSWQNGSVAVKGILAQKAEVDPYQITLLDGSGLSPDNRIKPVQMMQVLDFAFHHSPTNYQFISALPIAGIDGTLKHRLYNVARRVRAKTGTISGVVSLAGYAINKNKEAIAFVIIVNGHHGNIWKYRKMEDEIVTALAHYESMSS
jgi:D-alanyl-D-alanine carboxypeptidase/D-alanyl-D-alanine-endopeptidase (penicillin-binding protein 4)